MRSILNGPIGPEVVWYGGKNPVPFEHRQLKLLASILDFLVRITVPVHQAPLARGESRDVTVGGAAGVLTSYVSNVFGWTSLVSELTGH
jgi:hypothetical protein